MKYVFFGSPHFAAIVLQKLLDAGIPPVAIVCNPDRPVGRKQTISPPQTKIIAMAQKVPISVFQPTVFDHELTEQLQVLAADFFVVAAYAKIVPLSILEIPRLGTIGVHPSLLPQYRGSSPIQSALLSGEKETGTTLYLMDAKMDHGPVLAKDVLSIDKGDTYQELEERLAHLSGNALVSLIPNFMKGTVELKPQDETRASYTKKFVTEDGFVDSRELDAAMADNFEMASLIARKIKALNPEPGVWTTRDGKRVKLLEAKIDDRKLVLTKTQNEGERPKLIP